MLSEFQCRVGMEVTLLGGVVARALISIDGGVRARALALIPFQHVTNPTIHASS